MIRNPYNRTHGVRNESTIKRIVLAVLKFGGIAVAVVAFSALFLWCLTFAYNTTARVWHLPPMTWLELLCTTATLGMFAGSVGGGFGRGFKRTNGGAE